LLWFHAKGINRDGAARRIDPQRVRTCTQAINLYLLAESLSSGTDHIL